MTWDPATYGVFAQPRLRPALDLMARIGAEAPERVVDLGCGTGNVTRLLAARWPAATVAGLDSSPEMLAAARIEAPGIAFTRADAGTWRPEPPVDVLFSNAALHWLDDHAALLPRLLAGVAPGGWLAVQMPRNHGAPSHTGMVAAARSGPWATKLAPLLRPSPVAEPAVYYDLLAPLAAEIDIWETEYLHILDGADPVLRWTMGTALKPLVDVLDDSERPAFLADYAARMRAAYPPRSDGKTLFPFRRVFLVARQRPLSAAP
ncbi:MAG: methyltransferase domain-containing protein [Magnetospirillum sp.]|nr:methyltransferase domain-containing protein [Magnetospirillum sp.]